MQHIQSHITSFTQLNTWKEGHAMVLMVHRAIKDFPIDQRFSLANQMSRAVVSVTSNVAEGFGRISYKEKLQFYYTAQGSLTELQNQLLIARDLGYIPVRVFQPLAQKTIIVHKLLTGLIKYAKSTIRNT